MANQETAYGLRPVGLVGGATNSTGVTEYEIASDNTNAIYQYAIVVPLAAGVIDQAGATSGGTTQALGVLTGVMYHDSVKKKPVFLNHWPGSNNVSVDTNHPVKALVADNPNQLFQVASDASLTDRATALAGVFANASLGTSARTGSDDTGRSNSALSVSSIATTATLPLRVVGIVDDEANNDFTAAGIPLLVRLNAHFNASTRRFDSQTTADSTGI
ncbi:MAG TPA: hypothetical protein DCE29_13485 [Alteromonas macleodii]|jgi:hypothetical protein|nr:hypothetical protein [Alteromonas macleodii]|tara:strand:+ start:2453 stop:3103 length:651 start_codon:yes stop_codon:yes gene_type:complete